jgi:predicted nucleotidyltransferase
MLTTADETLIAEAGRRLADVAPDARVILFGSRARGDAGPDSDLDLLVVEPEIESRKAEFVRLRKALRGLDVAIDLVLVTERHVEEWGHFEGTMLGDALREGRVLAEAHA